MDFLQHILSCAKKSGVSVHADTIPPGYVFFALAQEQSRRLESIQRALSRGASAVVTSTVDRHKITNEAIFFAEDLKTTLLLTLQRTYIPDGVTPVLAAVTGTNGKSSTAWYLAQILRQNGIRCAYLGTTGGDILGQNYATRLTTPDICEFYQFLHLMLANECSVLAFEYSSHALDQDRLMNPAITYATFTNLSPDHLDYHGSMENYFLAKRKLFTNNTAQNTENYAILNIDDPYGRRLLNDSEIERKKVSYGFANDALFKILHYQICAEKTMYSVCWKGKNYYFETQLLGLPNIYNISAACTNAILMGISVEKLPDSVKKLCSVPGRFESIPNNKGFRIIIDYAHTPDALEKLLVNVRSITPGRVICVFGCGGNRDKSKRPIMGAIAEKTADICIVTSDNPRFEDPEEIISQILAGFSERSKVATYSCRKTAIYHALHIAAEGDTVVIAGKGHEVTQEINGVLYPFSDKQVVLEVLEQMQ